MDEPRPVIVKTLIVDKPPEKVFAFFCDIKNWEHGGAISNSKRVIANLWKVETPRGEAKIRIKPNQTTCGFDHDFITEGGEWTVYCRVTPNGRGSTTT